MTHAPSPVIGIHFEFAMAGIVVWFWTKHP